MSSTTLNDAVEAVTSDPALAAAVADQGASALRAFDLSEAEQSAIVEALEHDIEEARGEVEGFAMFTGGLSIPMPTVASLCDGSVRPSMNDISFTKQTNVSSPKL